MHQPQAVGRLPGASIGRARGYRPPKTRGYTPASASRSFHEVEEPSRYTSSALGLGKTLGAQVPAPA